MLAKGLRQLVRLAAPSYATGPDEGCGKWRASFCRSTHSLAMTMFSLPEPELLPRPGSDCLTMLKQH